MQTLSCNHCGVDNLVGTCPKCKKSFVITTTHLEKGFRDKDAKPLSKMPSQFKIQSCDYCVYNAAGKKIKAINSGLQQRTCAHCHKEFLSNYNLIN